ncbi:hypothetical protein Cni_G16025 [Canna indica]|uniref:Uncharacterized protein n=1 Tax=Canna indica TaxID=4628 RepID=A0AAQ3KER7_9LILI|nr:hypothetical protein Cni_G16025 [Canna indica]
MHSRLEARWIYLTMAIAGGSTARRPSRTTNFPDSSPKTYSVQEISIAKKSEESEPCLWWCLVRKLSGKERRQGMMFMKKDFPPSQIAMKSEFPKPNFQSGVVMLLQVEQTKIAISFNYGHLVPINKTLPPKAMASTTGPKKSLSSFIHLLNGSSKHSENEKDICSLTVQDTINESDSCRIGVSHSKRPRSYQI